MRIEPVAAEYDLASFDAVILTSVNAVRNAPKLNRKRVYCVGNRTRIAATRAGGEVFWTAENAEQLVQRLLTERPPGRLIHIRGKQQVIDVANLLTSGGLDTVSVVVYDQVEEPLGGAAKTLLMGEMPAILPLYSPRTAYLLGKAIEGPLTNVHVISISPAVATIWHEATGAKSEVCDVADGAEMVDRIVRRLMA